MVDPSAAPTPTSAVQVAGREEAPVAWRYKMKGVSYREYSGMDPRPFASDRLEECVPLYVAAALTTARREAFEEAARTVEGLKTALGTGYNRALIDAAAAIRAKGENDVMLVAQGVRPYI